MHSPGEAPTVPARVVVAAASLPLFALRPTAAQPAPATLTSLPRGTVVEAVGEGGGYWTLAYFGRYAFLAQHVSGPDGLADPTQPRAAVRLAESADAGGTVYVPGEGKVRRRVARPANAR